MFAFLQLAYEVALTHGLHSKVPVRPNPLRSFFVERCWFQATCGGTFLMAIERSAEAGHTNG